MTRDGDEDENWNGDEDEDEDDEATNRPKQWKSVHSFIGLVGNVISTKIHRSIESLLHT